MKIARIVGARPQFMQIPPMLDALVGAGHEHVLIHTGQHYDAAMSDTFFTDLGLPQPDFNLDTGSGTHGASTARMLERIEAALVTIRPDVVIADGDTNSTLAAALASVKLHLPVCHIEAGLRDFDRRRPEEVNRVLTDHASDLNCAPIPRALENLHHEGLGERSVLTGDVLCDCFVRYVGLARNNSWRALGLEPGRFHVMTLHRPENVDADQYDRFRDVMEVVTRLPEPVVFPVHPRTRPTLERYRREVGTLGALRAVEPVGYLEMLGLLTAADCVFTDSGGLPREAAWAGKRCVMLHRIDVWHDLLEAGLITIGRSDRKSIETAYAAARRSVPDSVRARAMFGGGSASQAIVAAVERAFTR